MPPKKGKKKGGKKKGKGKKLSKKQKAELERQRALEAEEEALRLAELERQRLELERKENIKKAKHETIVQRERMLQLEESYEVINRIVNYNTNLNQQYQQDVDWNLYVNVGRLPNPVKADMMTRYLHLWNEAMGEIMMEEVGARTKDVLYLLKELDYRIAAQELNDDSMEFINNLLWLRQLFREQQYRMLNMATYNRLRDIDKYFNQLGLIIAQYQFVDENDGNLIINLWLKLTQPKSLPNLRKQQLSRDKQIINFPNMKLSLQFPEYFDFFNSILRTMYLKYDHISDLCSTSYHELKQLFDGKNLLDFVKFEWNEKLEVMPEFYDENDENYDGPEPIPEYLDILDKTFDRIDFSIELLSEDEINLRKYRILGGIYHIELIEQPPQPQKFVHLTITITNLQIAKQLEMVDFFIRCELPEYPEIPEPTGSTSSTSEPSLGPELIEAYLKKVEEELDKLIVVTLTWPTNVFFFELPIICQWDTDKNFWTKENIFDIKHNEEKVQLTFRIGKFGIFGLAAYRYSNLPYQAWEIYPENDGSVTIQITCAIILVEFNVKDDGSVALVLFQNSPNDELMQDLIGQRMKLPQLILLMQERGVDIFPECDATCYVEGACEKQWEMERHLYFNMAQLSLYYNFVWSRWNLGCGYKQIILQMREYILDKLNVKGGTRKFRPIKQRPFKMLSVTTELAKYVDCTEVSPEWNDEPIDINNPKFCADLWNLIQWTTNNLKKDKINLTSYELIFGIFQVLQRTRICSFS